MSTSIEASTNVSFDIGLLIFVIDIHLLAIIHIRNKISIQTLFFEKVVKWAFSVVSECSWYDQLKFC